MEDRKETIISEWAKDSQKRNALYSLYKSYSDRARSWESQLFELLITEDLPEEELEKLTKRFKEFKKNNEQITNDWY